VVVVVVVVVLLLLTKAIALQLISVCKGE
jgi:hypothetical protein